MDLFFNWKGISRRGRALTYNDVLLVPSRSDVRSRNEPHLESSLTPKQKLKLPFISANMDTVTESPMAIAMNQVGGAGILHRFMSIEDQVHHLNLLQKSGAKLCSASIGVNGDYKERAQALVRAGCQLLTIDIAHGHSSTMIDVLQWLRGQFSDVEIIAGNVATPEGTRDLIEAGASAIKVGIGPGSMCTTRMITGCGLPQLTAVSLCSEVGRELGIPIIADGGIKTSGDILKAFAAGASSVMLGSLLAGTIESPGEIAHGKKIYRGMASRSAQDSWRGGVPKGMAPEGESTAIAVKGHVSDVIQELAGGVRSGMSYLNASSFEEIHEKAKFTEMSPMGYGESVAHGLS